MSFIYDRKLRGRPLSWVMNPPRRYDRLLNTVDWFLSAVTSRPDPKLWCTEYQESHLRMYTLDRPSFRQGVLLTRYSNLILNELKVDDANVMSIGIALQDVGKMGIESNILLKTAPLTAWEGKKLEKHTTAGYNFLKRRRNGIDIVTQPALAHHERYDGLGYPLGLEKEQIPIAARVAAVVDVFDALLTARPYNPAWDLEAVIDFLGLERGSRFDANVVDVVVENADKLYELNQEHISTNYGD